MMRYESIYIRDFGIFANAELRDLNPYFNIIGGGNRAGKTTFLKLLRYLPYGIPNKDLIPPARSNYNVEAILNDDENRYSLLIEGHANPKINILNKKRTEVKNIFSEVDKFTYNQLFTITLEELKKVPKGVRDKEKLQSVLMGAGLKEYTLIPKLKEYFINNANDIAGKYGKIDVGRFKEYSQRIEEGIELKNEAKSQVSKYYELEDDLDRIDNEIRSQQEEIKMKKKERNRLDLIKSNYQNIANLINLKNDLKKEKYFDIPKEDFDFYPQRADELLKNFTSTKKEFDKLTEEFVKLSETEYKEGMEDEVLKYSNKINRYYNDLSGLKERDKNIRKKGEELNTKYNSILKEANQIDEHLANNLDDLMDLKVNIENKNKLRSLVNEFIENNSKINNKKEKIEELKTDIESKKEQLDKIKKEKLDVEPNKLYLYSAILGIFLITYLLFINWRFIGLYIVDFIFIYKYYSSYQKKESYEKKLENIDNEIEELKNKKNIIKNDLIKLIEQKDKTEQKLDSIRTSLNLSKYIKPRLLKDYYQDILNLKNEYLEYKNARSDLREEKEVQKKRFLEIYNFILNFDNLLFFDDFKKENILDNITKLENLVRKIYNIKEILLEIKRKKAQKDEQLDELMNLEGMESIKKENREVHIVVKDYKKRSELIKEYNDKQEKISDINNRLTNITEQIKDAFKIDNQDDKEEIISIFVKEYNKYTSFKNVKDKYSSVEKDIEKLNKKLDNLKSKKEEISLIMTDFETEEKIITAETKINKARNNLKPLAENYAVNSMSSYILERYWQKFLEEKKDKLLNKASEIMRQITNGEYGKIEPLENLSDSNFKVHGENGRIYEEIDHLSRGTKEQLFMAIRINRIMEINPALPVIIDDSLVNFDPNHLKNIFEIINNLKDRNQIIFLTCHPEQVEFLDQRIDNKNYYTLKKGKFKSSTKGDLLEFLA